MRESALFATVARQQGYTAEQARGALTTTHTLLDQHGHPAHGQFYIYRTGQNSVGHSTAASQRPRTLLAFANADSALAFAQYNHLGPTPRLLRMSLAQLLAVMMQRPTISRLLFADEPIALRTRGTFPPGLQLDRVELLTMLKGEDTYEQPF